MKLLELERTEFIKEITDNWNAHKQQTRVKPLVKYMIENAFSKKAAGSLEKMTKEQLREIIINGDQEEPKEKRQPNDLAEEVADFLDDLKQDIHEQPLNGLVKGQIERTIKRQQEKAGDVDLIEKWGYFGVGITVVLLGLEMVFKRGYKDLGAKVKAWRAARAEQGAEHDERQ